MTVTAQTDTKMLYEEIYKPEGRNYGSFSESESKFPSEYLATIKAYIEAYGLAKDATVFEIGCGLGHLNSCHPNWQGIEYSGTAITLAKRTYGEHLKIHEGDATNLSLSSNSVDFLFTFATLEHIPEVEKAISEIERVLKPGGIAVLSPAWNCRPWTVKKLEQRPYSELGLSQKIEKFLIPLRNNLIFRMLCSMPTRLVYEIALFSGQKNIGLRYKKLEPDFSLWNRYGHITDDDAFVNIDAHAALIYFASRGWSCDSHPNAIRRFGCRGTEIVIRKPAPSNDDK
jgi:SAM-dependent methyltransferase